jgi:hypothetical protein
MKKIRIDYYRFRIKKGRADIYLQREEGKNEYRIPYHYVSEGEQIAGYISHHKVEDDSNNDLVIIDCTLNDCHLKKDDKEWISLDKVVDIIFSRNEDYHITRKILEIFMYLCPEEAEAGIRRKAIEMLDGIKTDIARKEYVAKLQWALDTGSWSVPDATYMVTDPELIKKEMESLEHFRIDEPIDWESLGVEINFVSFSLFPGFSTPL